jgi:amidase
LSFGDLFADFWSPWQEESKITELSEAMAEGRVTSFDLVQMYLFRIAQYDRSGPRLNSILEINPDALQIAQALDAERRERGPRGRLHGIPVLLKDNINTGDKMHTSAGSLALANSFAPRDSFVAEQLREAGAVILGKTNLTEWANFKTDHMPNGVSSRGGQVLNPYGPGTLDVGGSSAGSGAAVAANLAVAAIGTETSGSILSPSSQNMIVGIKPTVGLVSRSGIIPISHSQDTAGPMARTVTDAAILLSAITAEDERDPVTAAARMQKHADYTVFLDADGLKGARIGVPRKPYFNDLDADKLQVMERAISDLREAGAVIVDDVSLPNHKDIWNYNVLLYEFKSDLNVYLSSLGAQAPARSLKDVIEFNHQHAGAALKYGQTLMIAAEETSGTLTEPEYIESRLLDLYYAAKAGIDQAMTEHGLDALLFPSNHGAALPAKAGYPSVTVPGGVAEGNGEPVGITFTGMAFSEPSLIRLAYAYEQATLHRVAPKLS